MLETLLGRNLISRNSRNALTRFIYISDREQKLELIEEDEIWRQLTSSVLFRPIYPPLEEMS